MLFVWFSNGISDVTFVYRLFRHFDAMVRTLVRAGRARGMVAASLATGKRDEAYSLCQMHYAVSTAAAGVRKGGGGGDAGAPTNALARFAKEFGL